MSNVVFQVNDAGILLAVLASKKGRVDVIKADAESLPLGTIKAGKIEDKNSFDKALKSLVGRVKPGKAYAWVGLPESVMFLSRQQFPTLERQAMGQAVQTNAEQVIPFSTESAYIAWQVAQVKGRQTTVLVGASKKDIINEYISALSKHDLTPVAFETTSLSLARVYGGTEEVIMGIEIGVSETVFFVCSGGNLQTTSTIPIGYYNLNENVTNQEFIEQFSNKFLFELKRIINYWASVDGSKPTSVFLSGAGKQFNKIGEQIQKETGIRVELKSMSDGFKGLTADMLAVYGLVLRTVIPARDDTGLSLMPLAVKELNENKEAFRFYSRLSNIGFATVIVLTIVYAAVYFALLGIKQLQVASSVRITPTTSELEKAAQDFNSKVEIIKEVSQYTSRDWSTLISDVTKSAPAGIRINKLAYGGTQKLLTIGGVSTSRDDLLKYKDSLTKLSYLTEITLPDSALSSNIEASFTMTMKVSDE